MDNSTQAFRNEVAFVYFNKNGQIVAALPMGGSVELQSYVEGQWYDIELTFDWDAQTFDVAIDDVVRATDLPFRGNSTVDGVQRVSLYHFSRATTGYWDDIVFY